MSTKKYHELACNATASEPRCSSGHSAPTAIIGSPSGQLAQAIDGVSGWKGSVGYNEFSGQVEITGELPWDRMGQSGVWRDHEDSRAAEWLQRHGVRVSPAAAAQAIQVVAQQNPFHPVRRYLETLVWDGKTRLDGWLYVYLNVEPTDFTLAAGKAWLISAVARVYRPGVKSDHCLVLEGRQGIGKSRALSILGGEWFTDELAELGSKDSAMQLRGKWIVELAELDALNRTDSSRIKAFLSRSADRYRPPYARHVVEVKRQCVFAGTTNRSEYLADETGARRFWSVACGDRIELDDLARDRDQLWAEAVHEFRNGAKWWLEGQELEQEAAMEQAARYEEDPWHALVAGFLRGRSEVGLEDVWSLLDMEVADRSIQDQKRLRNILHALGWRKSQVRRDGLRVRVYRRGGA